MEGDAEISAQAAGKGRVGIGLRTEAVVNMDGVQRHAKLGGKVAEHVEEGDGVGAARQGDQDNFAAPGHPGAANGVTGDLYEALALHGPPSGGARRRPKSAQGVEKGPDARRRPAVRGERRPLAVARGELS